MGESFSRSGPDDEPRTELQRRVDGGEDRRAIIEELVKQWQAPLYAYARASLEDPRDAREIAQKVLVKMDRHFDSMIAREPIRAWIFTVAQRELKDLYRRKKARGGGDIQTDLEVLERYLARRPPQGSFEDQVETLVGTVDPLLKYLRVLVARGSLRQAHADVCWQVAIGGTQQDLADELGLTQPRISQMKSEVRREIRVSMYFCEILGLVRAPHRETAIRSHLDLADQTDALTDEDHTLLRRAGGVVQLDSLDRPVLLPKDAEAAIQSRQGSRRLTLHELHDAESKYAAAIPNPAPHCIQRPCPAHGSRT